MVDDDLPQLLALHPEDTYLIRYFRKELVEEFADEVLRYMEDGIFSRTEFRKIFACEYDGKVIDAMFSPWGGIFVHLARLGKVAFRDMTNRDFDLISAEPTQGLDEVLPDFLRRYLTVYGPATLTDAAWFFGYKKDFTKKFRALPLDEFERFDLNGETYYCADNEDMDDIPEITLLSGFDPLIVSYTERSVVLPEEYKSKVILKSSICSPTVAVNGRVAGLWNIKKGEPIVEFFTAQPKRIVTKTFEMADSICWRVG